jgi:hypothetical protein
MLDRQLEALSLQIYSSGVLAQRNIKPKAVLGYCFGEYAAAVCAGILSERLAVSLLVQRDAAINGASGSMLNVFADLKTVRVLLSCISDPPSVAIIAGPMHHVLSGSHHQIALALTAFSATDIKTSIIKDTVPFHSPAMDVPVLRFTQSACKGVQCESESGILFISGITAGALGGPQAPMPSTYWSRHMRDPILFFDAIDCARRQVTPNPVFIDVGPGPFLQKLIKRYEWSDVSVFPIDAYLENHLPFNLGPTHTPAVIPNVSDAMISPLLSTTEQRDPLQEALVLLHEMFGYDMAAHILDRSLHSLGMQSLDFLRFSEYFGAKTGIKLSLTSFLSDESLYSILSATTR